MSGNRGERLFTRETIHFVYPDLPRLSSTFLSNMRATGFYFLAISFPPFSLARRAPKRGNATSVLDYSGQLRSNTGRGVFPRAWRFTPLRISGFDHPPTDGRDAERVCRVHALRNLCRFDQKVIAFSFFFFFFFFFLQQMDTCA